MKIKCLFLTALLLAVTTNGFAQAKKPTAKTTVATPDQVVRNLYAARKSPQTDPFFQNKNRPAVDKFFVKEFADLIWKDADGADGAGTINFDPTYNAQDTQITAFRIGKPMYGEGNVDVADVPVDFKNFGKAQTVLYRLERGADQSWKISDIAYVNDNFTLRGSLMGEENFSGQFDPGKTDSVILYVGMETGDYAARCFANDSAVGKQILAACKKGDECEVVATKIDHEFQCRVEGLEADLSSSGKILSVKSARKLPKKK